MIVIISNEEAEKHGFTAGTYDVGEFENAGVEHTVGVMRGVLTQDDRKFILEGKLLRCPHEETERMDAFVAERLRKARPDTLEHYTDDRGRS